MEALKKFWSETMDIPEARWIVALAGLIICVATAYYVVKLFRDMAVGQRAEATNYIAEFQRMRDEGKLDDEEYSRLAESIPKAEMPSLGSQPKDSK